MQEPIEDAIEYQLISIEKGLQDIKTMQKVIDKVCSLFAISKEVLDKIYLEKKNSKENSTCVSAYISTLKDSFIAECEKLLLKFDFDALEKQYNTMLKSITEKQQPSMRYMPKFLESMHNKNFESYAQFYEVFNALWQIKLPLYQELLNITGEIGKIAPNLGKKIRMRELDSVCSIDDMPTLWKASYLNAVIEDRNALDRNEIQKELHEKQEEFRKIKIQLVKYLASLGTKKRITNEQIRYLKGIKTAQERITRSGTGKKDDAYRKLQRENLEKCYSAIPVWVMPIEKVLDIFTLNSPIFDVLIVDEASQADFTTLPLLLLAKQVIIVGDDKQVTPSNTGKNLDKIKELEAFYLDSIPNKELFDYKHSLYSIASTSFSTPIRLKEHFRCVPDIIQFCNNLQYNGAIKALRSSHSSKFHPALRPYYVEPEFESEKNINKAEALHIVAFIKAMCNSEEYKDATIGVISLSGQKQHKYIDDLLRTHIDLTEYEKHRIACGKPADFQGDERNIIFLSLVDTADTGDIIRLKRDNDKDRKDYNVAVSRAKDQLWIFHSMPPKILRSDDIRAILLEHAYNPRILVDKYASIDNESESPFETSVAKFLTAHKYSFQQQYEVGAYRLDFLLTTNSGQKIALECDGEKYHSSEEQRNSDRERQMQLERLAYKFIRIRGSDYYRRREKTEEELLLKLEELKVRKEMEQEYSTEVSDRIDIKKEAMCILKEIQEGE